MTPEETVRAFLSAWNRLDWDAIFALMAPHIRYHNMPWAPVEGIDAVRENLLAFGIEDADWTLHAIAANGPVVLTERTDRVLVRGQWLQVRVMGTFEVADGRVTAWRDYFDPAEIVPPA